MTPRFSFKLRNPYNSLDAFFVYVWGGVIDRTGVIFRVFHQKFERIARKILGGGKFKEFSTVGKQR